MKTTEQIQSELGALQAELDANNARSTEIDALQIELKRESQNISSRIEALTGVNRWSGKSDGLIDKVKLRLLESKSPIYEMFNNGRNRVTRIISVDKKWIELKCDGLSLASSTKYNRETGWRIRSRDDYAAIDAQKALLIWNEFNGVVL